MATAAVIDVSDASFATDVVEASHREPVVVDFWAAWCAPCRALGPILEEVVSRTEGVTLAKLDVDANPQTSMQFGIRGIPAVKAFRDGQVVDEFVGLQPRRAVERFVEALAPKPAANLPTDEGSLRTLLDADPSNVVARRALGRLLLEQGRLDEAQAELVHAETDRVSDGMLARIELLRAGELPASLDHGVVRDDELSVMEDIIAAIGAAAGETKSRLRRVALGVLAAQNDGPAVDEMRRRLASALF